MRLHAAAEQCAAGDVRPSIVSEVRIVRPHAPELAGIRRLPQVSGMPESIKRYVGFEIGRAFPANSPVARFVTRLAVVTNDLMLTQENTGLEYERPGGGREGVPLYYLFTAGSHFREAVKLLDQDLKNPEVSAFVAGLPADPQARLSRLRSSYEPWKSSFVESRLKPLRDQTFHYPSDGDVTEALERAAPLRSGMDLGSGTYLETRYDFADQIITTLAAAALGESIDELQKTLERFAELMMDYVYFSHAVVTHYLKSLPRELLDLRKRAE